MTCVLITPPVAEPVSLAEAKAWLRLDTSDEDALVTALIVAARASIEALTRRALMTQTWRLVLDGWASPPVVADPLLPACVVELPLAPVTSVAAIRVYDALGNAQVVNSSTWTLVDTPDDARVLFKSQPPTPGRPAAGIEIDVVTGYGAATDVPQALRQALLMLVARWFENRGDAEPSPSDVLPAPVAQLIAPYRRVRLA